MAEKNINPHLEKLPSNPHDRKLLGDFYDTFCNTQWFRGAYIVEKHPTHMRKTLVVECEYKPIAAMKDILMVTQPLNISLDWVVLTTDAQTDKA